MLDRYTNGPPTARENIAQLKHKGKEKKRETNASPFVRFRFRALKISKRRLFLDNQAFRLLLCHLGNQLRLEWMRCHI